MSFTVVITWSRWIIKVFGLAILAGSVRLSAQQAYIDDGAYGQSLRTVELKNIDAGDVEYWYVELFRKGAKPGDSNRWGLITGDSANAVLADLKIGQEFEPRWERFVGAAPGSTQDTYLNSRGPIAKLKRSVSRDRADTASRIVSTFRELENAYSLLSHLIAASEGKGIGLRSETGRVLADYADALTRSRSRLMEASAKLVQGSDADMRAIADALEVVVKATSAVAPAAKNLGVAGVDDPVPEGVLFLERVAYYNGNPLLSGQTMRWSMDIADGKLIVSMDMSEYRDGFGGQYKGDRYVAVIELATMNVEKGSGSDARTVFLRMSPPGKMRPGGRRARAGGEGDFKDDEVPSTLVWCRSEAEAEEVYSKLSALRGARAKSRPRVGAEIKSEVVAPTAAVRLEDYPAETAARIKCEVNGPVTDKNGKIWQGPLLREWAFEEFESNGKKVKGAINSLTLYSDLGISKSSIPKLVICGEPPNVEVVPLQDLLKKSYPTLFRK